MIEYKWKRTPYSKTYHIDRHTKRMEIFLNQLHYRVSDKKQTEINTQPAEIEGGWVVETPYYTCEIIRFPFEIKINKHSIRHLDSPDTNFPEVGHAVYFPRCGILISFRPEGVDIEGAGTWKIDGQIRQKERMTYNFAPVLSAETPEDYLRVTKTTIPGEMVSHEIKTSERGLDFLEVIYTHGNQAWKHIRP